MKAFMNDLIGAIFDVLKLVCYFLAGVAIVSIVMYAVKLLLDLISILLKGGI
ncbi:hypothetical protein QWY14_02730 [Planococcus sp. N028]|uniref:Uncharacterized protein n=1 Tax=Planococcus shixiaomingii TaxID=3058393 RepID=A0ABT8MYI0_9BACL|nr:hypothetical protein [Planococcus sp. N028]MDN7240684.1 hypothetical protein [Planococcus sp. N028]